MILGLTGCHGAGKSTLARAFCEKNGIYRMGETSTSAIMRAHGMDPAGDYPIYRRIWIQDIILTELDKFYAGFREHAIFDRTPLDAAAYLLADVQRTNVSLEEHELIAQYVQRAIRITNNRFALIVALPPVLPRVQREGKAPSLPGYDEHIHLLVQGLRTDERMSVPNYVMGRNYVDLGDRVFALESVVGRTLRKHLADIQTDSLNGIFAH